MRTWAFLLATATVFIADAASAQSRPCCREEPHWYAGIAAHAVYLTDVELEASVPISGSGSKSSYDIGFGAAGSFGYLLTPSIRLEGELAYRSNDVAEVNGVPIAPSSGNSSRSTNRTMALMGNAFYDYHNETDFTPYIGAGAGMAMIKHNLFTVLTVGPDSETQFHKAWVPAYQFMTGFNYAIDSYSTTPIEIWFGYRYFATMQGKTDFALLPGFNEKFDNNAHEFEVGMRLYVF